MRLTRMPLPLQVRGRGLDRDAPLPLNLEIVGGRSAFVDVPGLADPARNEEEPLRQARLACVDMGENPNISERKAWRAFHGPAVYIFVEALRSGREWL